MKKLFCLTISLKTDEGDFGITFLNIPEWLNEEAAALGMSFSQVLQEAPIHNIGIK